MADIDFSDEEAATAWFRQQRTQVSCAIASRAALRIVASSNSFFNDGRFTRYGFTILRALITSATHGIRLTASVNWQERVSNALLFVDYGNHRVLASDATNSATNAAASAFQEWDAETTRYDSATAAAKAILLASEVVGTASYEATTWDADHLGDALFTYAVWQGAEIPSDLLEKHKTLLEALRSEPALDFWVRFYEGMWNGTFTNWDLAIEVIKIDEDDWTHKNGHKHIAEVIAGIEARLNADAGASPVEPDDVLPDNVTSLFERAPVVQASMTTLATTTSLHIDVFSRLTRPNEEIPFFETLKALPATAQKIATLVTEGPQQQ